MDLNERGLESNHMPGNIPETPKQTQEADCFEPQEWLGQKNSRAIIHIGRDIMLGNVREILRKKEPTMAALGGFCLFRTYIDESEIGILITNNSKISGPRSTVVSINKLRSPEPHERGFPDGRALEMLDVSIPHTSRWLNTSRGTMFRGQHDSSWTRPKTGTLLQPRNGNLDLYGNLANGNFTPAPARDTQEVGEDAEALWSVYSALVLCNEVTLCDDITSMSVPK